MDFPSPTDLDQQVRRAVTTPSLSTAPGGTVSAPFADWWRGAQQRLFGQELVLPQDPARAALLRGVMNLGKPAFEPTMPVPDSTIATRPPVEFDFLRSLKHGFDDSFLGGLRAWSALDGAMHFDADPDYDPFTDRRIKDSPFAGQWHFFEGSRSARETDWIMSRLLEKQREGDAINRMNGPAAAVQFAGGIMGDPMSFLPLSFGAKGAWLAAKGRQMNAVEQAAFGFKPVILGGMNDGLRAMGAQASIMVGQAAIRAGVDPTYELDSIADLLAVPMAIAGSATFALGGFTRFSNALNVLQRRHAGDPDFMGATMPAGRAVPRDATEAAMPHGPTGLDPADDLLAGKNPGLNPVDNDPRDAALRPGALATDYATIRAHEGGQAGFGQPRERADFTAFMAGNKVAMPDGQPLMVFHGTTATFDHFDDAKLGSNTGAPSAFQGHFFASNPETSNAGYANFQVVDVPTGGDITFTRSSLFERLFKGQPKVKEVRTPITFREELLGEGAQVRPTYLRMTNPYEIVDRQPYKATPQSLLGEDYSPRSIVEDVDGKHWRINIDMDDGAFEAWNDLPDRAPSIPTFEPVKRDGQGWVVDGSRKDEPEIMMAAGEGRQINYNDEIVRAKKAGHDGVIIRNSIDGGGFDTDVYVVFDAKTQIKNFDERWDVSPPGSVGAAGTPGSALHNRQAQLDQARMAATGIGLERLPIDMVARAAMLPFTSWHGTIEDLVGSGGRIRVKNQQGIPSALPVETEIARRWNRPMVDSIRTQHDEWRAYRQSLDGTPGNPDATDFQRLAFEAKTRFGDLTTKGERPLSFEAFRRRVGDALITSDADELADAASPFVNKAAARIRQHLDDLKKEAVDVGLFRQAYDNQIAKLQGKLAKMKKDGASDEAINAEQNVLKTVQEHLDNLLANGPTTNTAPSYRPRYWLVDQLRSRETEFKEIVAGYYHQHHKLPVEEARKIADRVHDTLSRHKTYITKADVETLIARVADPMSALARTFEIPDKLVKDFLENDAETILRAHTRQMGTSIEMMRRFGSTGLEAEADEIMAEAGKLMKEAVSPEVRAEIRRQVKIAVADLEAARDRLYGTYGADADPHSWSNRLIRMAKQFTNITLLGGAGMTALADLIRPAMTEGLQAMNHYGFKTLASESRATILKMSRKELELAGDAMELMNNVRALSASDTGDLMHSRTGFERWLNQANQYFFVANGLNAINQIDKEWAGLIIQGRINDIAVRVAKGGALSSEDATRLAAAGIDETMLKRIGAEIEEHGEKFRSIRMANSGAWTDELARQHYGNALNQMVNRTVPTPGMGDRPNWFSSPIGGLIAQYKAFAAGALTRILYSGLQEGGAKFWYGAASSVAFAIVLNEIRSRLFYDRSTFDRPMTAVIADGFERSSLLGWFSDINRAVETLSGHQIGVRPLIGAERPRKDDATRQVGTFFGPAAGQGFNAMNVLAEFMSGHPTAKTYADARRLIPGQSLPYLDPAMDHAISDGRWHREVETLRRVNRQE